jgi:hypothetical protein
MRRSRFLVLWFLLLTGCASARLDYRPPGQRFFVINNFDRASGLINISSRGYPARFVDCGTIVVAISGLNEKTQTIDGAAADAQTNGLFPGLHTAPRSSADASPDELGRSGQRNL